MKPPLLESPVCAVKKAALSDIENRMIQTNKKILCCDLGQIEYKVALRLQHDIVLCIIDGSIDHPLLLFLEHPPVFTLGKNKGRENLIVPESFLKEKNIQIIPIERGGNITYHGPGQLVVYPIINLHQTALSVMEFVDGLEKVMIRTAGDFGIRTERNKKNHGVWIGPNKLGSIGIAIRRGVSFHGLAMNINNSLAPFSWIHPCGLEGVSMTSLKKEIGNELNMKQVKDSMKRHFSVLFEFTLEEIDRTVFNQMILNKQKNESRLQRENHNKKTIMA
ncbi:lipoyl(octanoyl) transferase LipB [bacterium]|nr:lipoyl(octanoyl) transferase LipB [bacterium]